MLGCLLRLPNEYPSHLKKLKEKGCSNTLHYTRSWRYWRITKFFFIQGQDQGGCARSKGSLAVGCASPGGLAATRNEDFFTAHDLLCSPVVEEGDEI
jgi:hypothetical protein